MKIDITNLEIKIIEATGIKKHENLLAFVTLIFRGELGEYFTISGFTLWISKHGGYNVEEPQRPGFQYCLFEKSLWGKIKKEIIEQFEYKKIPVVEENK